MHNTYLCYHPDHLGSTSLVTNSYGEITQNVSYIPYGEIFVEETSGGWQSPYYFNAKELDEETGLYCYGARYLDPTSTRWLSVDPMWEDAKGVTPYHYCHGNPIVMVDEDGRIDEFTPTAKDIERFTKYLWKSAVSLFSKTNNDNDSHYVLDGLPKEKDQAGGYLMTGGQNGTCAFETTTEHVDGIIDCTEFASAVGGSAQKPQSVITIKTIKEILEITKGLSYRGGNLSEAADVVIWGKNVYEKKHEVSESENVKIYTYDYSKGIRQPDGSIVVNPISISDTSCTKGTRDSLKKVNPGHEGCFIRKVGNKKIEK